MEERMKYLEEDEADQQAMRAIVAQSDLAVMRSVVVQNNLAEMRQRRAVSSIEEPLNPRTRETTERSFWPQLIAELAATFFVMACLGFSVFSFVYIINSEIPTGPRGYKGETGEKGKNGRDGNPGTLNPCNCTAPSSSTFTLPNSTTDRAVATFGNTNGTELLNGNGTVSADGELNVQSMDIADTLVSGWTQGTYPILERRGEKYYPGDTTGNVFLTTDDVLYYTHYVRNNATPQAFWILPPAIDLEAALPVDDPTDLEWTTYWNFAVCCGGDYGSFNETTNYTFISPIYADFHSCSVTWHRMGFAQFFVWVWCLAPTVLS